MSCYFIAQININDQEEYDKYLEGFDEIFDQFNGEVLAVDDQVTVLEGDWPFGRSVLIRFTDKSAFWQWYQSPAYQKLAEYRRRASTANIVLIKDSE